MKIDYKDVNTLKKYITKRGKILPSAKTGLTGRDQRVLAREIKKARYMALVPYVNKD
jgi:small subunit ribosomal protein S18